MAIITISGNTSGSISLSAPDISGSNTLTLPVATDTLIGKATTDTLTNKSIAATQLTGTIAAAALPAGSVIQVVQGTYGAIASNATTTLADTGLTATITPRSTSSKILVIFHQAECANSVSLSGLKLVLLRGATIINTFATYGMYGVADVNAPISSAYLDSPATTSPTTYKTQFSRSPVNSGTIYVQASSSGSTSTITLMEIQG
jgi:hypothetical protein